jgi:hypothetical protein
VPRCHNTTPLPLKVMDLQQIDSSLLTVGPNNILWKHTFRVIWTTVKT